MANEWHKYNDDDMVFKVSSSDDETMNPIFSSSEGDKDLMIISTLGYKN